MLDASVVQGSRPDTIDLAVPVDLAAAVQRMIAGREARAGVPGGRLDYETPLPMNYRPVADWSILLALVFCCGMVHAVAAVVVPVYEAHFRNWGTKLPTMTVGMVWFSRFVTNGYGWLYFWPFAFVIPVLVAALRRTPPQPGSGFGLPCVLILAGTAFLLLFSQIALGAPFVVLGLPATGGTSAR